MIWRSNASELQVHGQFGTTDAAPWPAKSGYAKYNNIYVPQTNRLSLRLRYSRHNGGSAPIQVYLDGEATPRAILTVYNQNSWDSFAWTDWTGLGSVSSGLHSIKFYTTGQQHGVADLDLFQLVVEP